jgi:hypothetical protein
VTVYLARVSVCAAIEADCAQDAVDALANAVERKVDGGVSVLTNKEDLCASEVEFCPLHPHRCALPHGGHNRRLSRYADACEAEDGTQADLTAPPLEPLVAEAFKAHNLTKAPRAPRKSRRA